ncbi:PIG-L deacetylase family protein [Rhizobium sp. NFR12]|uniref:PIG-L deacetylase family protein n=1 Tax=Rhizobium sp. NFR12 TaxID=1566261 RepID=UPI0008A788EC|nr:PIG-L deacetylase family protein [Rhizobium sp. NFR12]SEH27346.1 N-acetylglucosaminyl deacetylase, LmbE family [Rhizobium sp. NFR12]
MKPMFMVSPGERLSILCLGAHSDDIEIGAGGTILDLISKGVLLDVTWCVLSAGNQRVVEAQESARSFLKGAASVSVKFGTFDDSFFPSQSREIKDWLNNVRAGCNPDIIFTHAREDAHQDHREISRLSGNVFRDHLIMEYEIPKWDGDISRPNVYVPLSDYALDLKVALLLDHFGTQRSKDWFDAETFRGLARLRGIECRAPARFAEAFTVRKMTFA